MQKRRKLGLEGEDRAAQYLEAKGYRIVARNVRADRVEIDLVARRGTLLVFVEVKARRGTTHGQAAEAVDLRKQRRLRRGAWAWLETDPEEARGTRGRRFDVVTCIRGTEQSAPDSAGRSESAGHAPKIETAAPEQMRRSIHSSEHPQEPERPEQRALRDVWTFEHWMAAF